MNVFVLCTGRCGSTTFIKASGHITNFTSGHESRHAFIGNSRLAYAPAHIEADNRLTWLLGRLDRFFGKDAYYVHLQRDILETAESYAERWDTEVGIMKAYRCGILMRREPAVVPSARDKLAMALDYCMTVNENILYFLKDKPNQMDFRLENAANDWERFWKWIGARGDFAASLGEWNIKHNARKTAPGA